MTKIMSMNKGREGTVQMTNMNLTKSDHVFRKSEDIPACGTC